VTHPRVTPNRIEVARLAAIGQRLSHEMIGTELGYSYAGSPLICTDDEPPAGHSSTIITSPTTRPGFTITPCLAGTTANALHDRIGSEFTLISLGGNHANSCQRFRQSFKEFGAPASILFRSIALLLERSMVATLVLVRPDLACCLARQLSFLPTIALSPWSQQGTHDVINIEAVGWTQSNFRFRRFGRFCGH